MQLTLKPLLLDKHGTAEHPTSMDSVTPGQLLFGYCASITRIGVFVRYGGTLTALAPRANLSDKFVADPSEFFTKGTSTVQTMLLLRC